MATTISPDEFRAARVVNEFVVAGITLVLLDYLYTLPQEVSLVWPTRMSVSKGLFFAVRYGTLLLAASVGLATLSQNFPAKDCAKIFTVNSVVEVILSCLGEAIIYIRVWAFSGCDRRALYYLVGQAILIVAGGFSLLGKFLGSAKVTSAAPLTGFSCVVSAVNSIYVALVYVVLLYSVIALMSVMIAIGVYRYKSSGVSDARSGLLVQFYRDGLVYFIMLGALCIANIVCHMVARRGYMVEMQIYLHSIIATRMLLHLREYAARRGEAPGQSVYADASAMPQDLVETKSIDILKAVLPSFGPIRRRDVAGGRISPMHFAPRDGVNTRTESIL